MQVPEELRRFYLSLDPDGVIVRHPRAEEVRPLIERIALAESRCAALEQAIKTIKEKADREYRSQDANANDWGYVGDLCDAALATQHEPKEEDKP